MPALEGGEWSRRKRILLADFLSVFSKYATMSHMDFDPHTLNQIIQKIQQQMRCPQCGEKVPVSFTSVRLTGDDFMLLQLKCEVCDAYIVLHAALQGKKIPKEATEDVKGMNASSSLCLKEGEIEILRSALDKAGGSFEELFKMMGK